jgi:hypothetical protein
MMNKHTTLLGIASQLADAAKVLADWCDDGINEDGVDDAILDARFAIHNLTVYLAAEAGQQELGL